MRSAVVTVGLFTILGASQTACVEDSARKASDKAPSTVTAGSTGTGPATAPLPGAVQIAGMPATIFSAAELSPPSTVTKLTSEQLRQRLNQDGAFFSHLPSEPSEPSEPCYDQVYAQAKVRATSTLATLEAELDFTACQAGWQSYKATYLWAVSCSNGDLSGLNGADLNRTEDMSVAGLCPNGTAQGITNVRFSFTTFPDAATGAPAQTTTGVFAIMATGGAPCQLSAANGIVTYADGCLAVNVSSDGTYQRYAYRGLKAQAKAKNYIAGAMDVTYNDWQGSVTFAGANVDPTYQLSGPSGPISGTITYQPSSGASLTDRRDPRPLAWRRFGF